MCFGQKSKNTTTTNKIQRPEGTEGSAIKKPFDKEAVLV